MNEILTKLADYIENNSSLIKITISGNGNIIKANAFAERLAGKSLNSTHIKDFFTCFNAELDLETFLKNEVSNALINVNTLSNIPETFYFTSFKISEGILLIGELNNKETETMRKTMLSLNNELNNLNRELQKSNIQLDQANKLKSQFLGMAAHDLRNPISSILGYSEFVLESEDYEISDKLRRIIDVIRNSSEFMLNLLEELLDVSKIESGKLQLNIEKVQLDSFLKNIVEINSIVASKKNIAIVLDIPQSLPKISIDPIKIEQVLNNLLSNAIKYSNINTTITVTAFQSDDFVIVSVQDQGLGIPENELPKLFLPFSVLSVRGTAGEKSTGLGLSIVKRIISGHSGEIWVESKVGKGSNFSFSIPLKH
ncbi:MAG: HAMP domain-containing histidine kinase [Bacteroidales bacterium]|nr:HAMP domain-containing histidine kinase [Bacteroidales bacterium]